MSMVGFIEGIAIKLWAQNNSIYFKLDDTWAKIIHKLNMQNKQFLEKKAIMDINSTSHTFDRNPSFVNL
jgi:hypothetical protein